MMSRECWVPSGGRYLCHRWCSPVPGDTSSWRGRCRAGDTVRSWCPSLGPRRSNTLTWSPGSCYWRSSDTGWSGPRWSRSLLGYLESERKRPADPLENQRSGPQTSSRQQGCRITLKVTSPRSTPALPVNPDRSVQRAADGSKGCTDWDGLHRIKSIPTSKSSATYWVSYFVWNNSK